MRPAGTRRVAGSSRSAARGPVPVGPALASEPLRKGQGTKSHPGVELSAQIARHAASSGALVAAFVLCERLPACALPTVIRADHGPRLITGSRHVW